MRTMSGSPCLHYDCSNRNSFGYCKTTVCINEHYQQEQWGSPSTTNKSESIELPPLVRCENCKYCRKVDESEYWCYGFCSPARLVRKDDFCSYGCKNV